VFQYTPILFPPDVGKQYNSTSSMFRFILISNTDHVSPDEKVWKGVIRSRKSMKGRQYNGQRKSTKKTIKCYVYSFVCMYIERVGS